MDETVEREAAKLKKKDFLFESQTPDRQPGKQPM